MMKCCCQWGRLACLLVLFQNTFSSQLHAETPPPDPARWEAHIQAFEQDDEQAPKKPGQVLFVGSSSIVGWNLEKSFPELDIVKRGYGGSNLSDTVHFFNRIVVPYRPRTIVVYAGDNDLASAQTPQQVAEYFRQLIEKRQKQLPDSELIFIGIKPSFSRWHLIENIRLANSLIKEICEQTPRTTFLDVDAPMLGEDGQLKRDYFVEDGLHLSDEGYVLWSDLLRPLITQDARLSLRRSLSDPYHPWQPPQDLESWQVEQERIRKQIAVACGLWPMPEKTPLNPTVHGLTDVGDYTIEKVYFSSMPGLYVTGELYRPKNVTGKLPAVLCPHGHWPDGRFYNAKADDAQKELQSGSEKHLSGAHHPLQARAVQLARMGCIAFFYDMIGYADQGPLDHREGFSDAQASLWLHNILGLQTWNSLRAIDFICSLPDVDPTRLGVTGASGGGTQTMLMCALDSRPTVAFPAVMVSTEMQGGCICENADYLRIGLNNIAFAAAFAPRPQGMSGADDWTIQIETRGLPELKQVYSLYGESDLVEARCFPQFQHNYNQVAREMMYDLFNQHLDLGLSSPVTQTDFWPRTRHQQTVFNEQHPRPVDALTAVDLREQMKLRDQQWLESLCNQTVDDYQAQIRPAVDVMLPAAQGELRTLEIPSSTQKEEGVRITKTIVSCQQMHIPTRLLLPATHTNRVVLWFDGSGSSHLLTSEGKTEPAVQKLLNQGYAVASADLLLTGQPADQANPYTARLSLPSSEDQPDLLREDYPGFLYCYNLPLISERINDIDRVFQFLKSQGFEQVHLIGTGEAGVWTLLARARWNDDAVASTTVDLQGFRFSAIDSVLDHNLLPGALKYGGIGGLAALAHPASLTITGAGDLNDAEIIPLKKIYKESDALILKTDSLDRHEIITLLP